SPYYLHDALAGSAQLQNGTGSAAIETYYSYSGSGRLNQAKQLYNSTTGTQWITTSRTYDSHGNLVTMIDPGGNTSYYSYSSKYQAAYLTNETRVAASTRIIGLYGYDFLLGTRTSSVDPNGYNTTYQYDMLGRPTRIAYSTG